MSRIRIARCDYDKPNRCPGWSGSGWTGNRKNWCEDVLPEGVRRWKQNGEDGGYGRWWHLRVRQTNCCGTYVLPQVLVWVDWHTWIPRRYGPRLWWWYPGRVLRQIPDEIRIARYIRRKRREEKINAQAA